MVVLCYLRLDVRIWCYQHRSLAYTDARLGASVGIDHRYVIPSHQIGSQTHILCRSVRVYDSYRYHPSYYEPTNRTERYHRAYRRIYVTGQADSDDDVQNMGVYRKPSDL